MAEAVLFYDGVCGLCDRVVQFVLRRDHKDRFRFAALQGDFARAALARHGRTTEVLDTIYLVLDRGTPHERLLAKSDAALETARRLGFPWRLLWVLRVLPRAWRDLAYDAVARNRYRLFGRAEACILPSPEHRSKFIADAEPTAGARG